MHKAQETMGLNVKLLPKDMKVRWNTTYDMIKGVLDNIKALPVFKQILLNDKHETVDVPMLSHDVFRELKELMPFLDLFKQLTLLFSNTTKLRVSECALEFEDILVKIKTEYLNDDNLSDKFKLAVRAAYAKLTKYYSKQA